MKTDRKPRLKGVGAHSLILACPRCGGANMKHESVTALWNTSAVLDKMVVSSSITGSRTENLLPSHPQPDMVSVVMRCRQCGTLPAPLCIESEDGSTYITWGERWCDDL